MRLFAALLLATVALSPSLSNAQCNPNTGTPPDFYLIGSVQAGANNAPNPVNLTFDSRPGGSDPETSTAFTLDTGFVNNSQATITANLGTGKLSYLASSIGIQGSVGNLSGQMTDHVCFDLPDGILSADIQVVMNISGTIDCLAGGYSCVGGGTFPIGLSFWNVNVSVPIQNLTLLADQRTVDHQIVIDTTVTEGQIYPFNASASGISWGSGGTVDFSDGAEVQFVLPAGVSFQSASGVLFSDLDGDGIPNDIDNCPAIPNPGQEDIDGDGIGDVCDPLTDSDGDGVEDSLDNCPATPNPGQEDTDGDGIGDACDALTDSDGDGVEDSLDNCPAFDNPGQEDRDGDGLGDACDDDADNDGVLDRDDADPLDPMVCEDRDGDYCDDCGIGQDGFGPLPDFLPDQDGPDNDGDSLCDVGDPDDDNDLVLDVVDNCPIFFNPGQEDTDGDGIGDACDPLTDSDGDGVEDALDNCPATSNPGQEDTDGDGIGDACDPLTDSDGDGVENAMDNCPATPNPGQEDTDGDGIGDACDALTDSDGDGVADAIDNCPFDSNPGQEDTDGDGLGDYLCDADDDNDGITDDFDDDPSNPMVCMDSDGDFCDDCTVGQDGFGPLPDAFPTDDGPDNDGDFICDAGDTDDDNDLILDSLDNCPFDINPDQEDSDGDGIGDACDTVLPPGVVFIEDFELTTSTGNPIDFTMEREDGTFQLGAQVPGWTRTGYPDQFIKTNGASGNTSILLNEFGADPQTLSRDIDGFVAGETYQLEFEHWGDNGGFAGYSFVWTIGGDSFSVAVPTFGSNNGNFRTVVYEFEAAGPGTNLSFAETSQGAGSPVFDNIVITHLVPDIEDSDGDGVDDVSDNCPTVPNPGQIDDNNDGYGDACVPPGSISPKANVGANPVIGEGTRISGGVSIGDNVDLGNNVRVRKDCNIGDDVTVGNDSQIAKGSLIGNGVSIGENTFVRKGVVIGDGTQIGDFSIIRKGVEIGANVTIGSNVVIQKGTVIPAGSVIPDGWTVPPLP